MLYCSRSGRNVFHSCSLNVAESLQGSGADLKEDGLSVHSPEVGDGVTTVTTARQQLQRGVTARTKLL